MSSSRSRPAHRLREVLARVALAVPVACVVLSSLAWLPALPDMVAFHWDAAGRVDGTVQTVPLFWLAASGSALGPLIGLVLLSLRRLSVKDKRDYIFWAGSLAGLSAAGWIVPAGLTYHAGSAADAELDGWIALLAAAVFYGAVPRYLLPDAPSAPARPAATVPVSQGEQLAWSRTITTGWLAVIAIVLAAIAAWIFVPMFVVHGPTAAGVVGLVAMVFAVLALLSFAIVRVSIDWRGLRVSSLVTRLPFMRVPLDQVLAVKVAELRPADWGGWGLRRKSGTTALILGAGDGLTVTATGNRRYALTVAMPEEPAGVLAALADRA